MRVFSLEMFTAGAFVEPSNLAEKNMTEDNALFLEMMPFRSHTH